MKKIIALVTLSIGSFMVDATPLPTKSIIQAKLELELSAVEKMTTPEEVKAYWDENFTEEMVAAHNASVKACMKGGILYRKAEHNVHCDRMFFMDDATGELMSALRKKHHMLSITDAQHCKRATEQRDAKKAEYQVHIDYGHDNLQTAIDAGFDASTIRDIREGNRAYIAMVNASLAQYQPAINKYCK